MAEVKQAYTAKNRVYNGTHGNLSAQIGSVKKLSMNDGDSLEIFGFDIGVRLVQLKVSTPAALGVGVKVSAQLVKASDGSKVADVILEKSDLAAGKGLLDSDKDAYFPVMPDLQEDTRLVLTFTGAKVDKKEINYIAYTQSVGNA
ncbi:hypothetical protein ABV540_003761 [Vibrio fluvialis]